MIEMYNLNASVGLAKLVPGPPVIPPAEPKRVSVPIVPTPGQAAPTPAPQAKVPSRIKTKPKLGPPVAVLWSETKCSGVQGIETPSPDKPVSKYFKAKSFIAKNGDVANVSSFVTYEMVADQENHEDGGDKVRGIDVGDATNC